MTIQTRRPWPKAVLFDLDDTLWPIAPVIVQAEQQLYDWLRVHAPRVAERNTIDSLRQARITLLAQQPEFQLDLGKLRRAGLVAAFAEVGEDESKIEQAMVEFFAARNSVVPYDDVLPGLMRLKGRVQLGSVSNCNADLKTIGLSHHFKVSVAAHEVGCAKPDAAIFHAACQRLGIDPSEAVYVGDDVLLDVQGAQRAGLRAVWLNRTASQAHLDHGVQPDAVVPDIHALIDWLHAEHA